MAKNTVVDKAIEDKKTRERRPVYFYGIPAGTKIETIELPGGEWDADEAIAQLKAKLGADVQIIGPNYKVKGAVKADSAKLIVKIDIRSMKPSGKIFEGVYNGWKWSANGIKACKVDGEEFGDNELGMVQFDSLEDEKVKTAKPRFSGKIVRLALLETEAE